MPSILVQLMQCQPAPYLEAPLALRLEMLLPTDVDLLLLDDSLTKEDSILRSWHHWLGLADGAHPTETVGFVR